MSIKAEIIADSINIVGNRLTTFVLEYPRFVHSEFMTHRMFSKNAASSRAIPIEKMIQQVMDNPAMPVWWGKNQSGMQAKEELSDEPIVLLEDGTLLSPKEYCIKSWLKSRDLAVERVLLLNKQGLHKQIANRILEPWFNIRIICSATEYENFFALRAHEDAQPEIRVLAEKMLQEYNKSEPKLLQPGEWHIPFGDRLDQIKIHNILCEDAGLNLDGEENEDYYLKAKEDISKKIAVARCARISYFNFEGKDDYEADIRLCDRLFANNPKHLSPTEHVAQALDSGQWKGNFCGFKQYRKFFIDENLKDSRVIKHDPN